MKSLSFCNIIISIFLISSANIYSQISVEKNETRTHAIKQDAAISISNKYGDIEINTWDQDSVRIEFHARAQHKDRDKADELLERITSIEKGSPRFFHVHSDIELKNDNSIGRFFKRSKVFDFDKSKVDINYVITLPQSVTLTITNKFGDISLLDSFSNSTISLGHGNLRTSQPLKDVNLDFSYVTFNTKHQINGTIKLSNSKIKAADAGDIKLTSISSYINFDRVNNVVLNSKRDEVNFQGASNLDYDMSFTDLYLGEITGDIHGTSNLGSITVIKTLNSRPVINLRSTSSDIFIDIANTSFDLLATLEKGSIQMPEAIDIVKHVDLDQSENKRSIEASYGSQDKGQITFNSKKTSIILVD